MGNKLTCLLAIEPGDHRLPPQQLGSVENPRRWVRCIQNGGTTVVVFRDFCDHICSDIEANPIPDTDDHRVFLWENLRSHHAAYVNQTVTGRTGPCRFTIVPRPPYQPKYGPIEYKICDLHTRLRSIKNRAGTLPDWSRRYTGQLNALAHLTLLFNNADTPLFER